MIDEYQLGKDITELRAEIAELRASIKQARHEAVGDLESSEEHLWEVLQRLGICHYEEDPADDYVLGPAFEKK